MNQIEKVIIYACGEAQTEKAFLRHIKVTYKNASIQITVDCAHGSDPDVIVNYALRNAPSVSKRRLVLLDIDKPWSKELEGKAQKENIEMIASKPCCIEGFFLSLLESKFTSKHSPGIKGNCKSAFRKYLNDREKLDFRKYQRIFPKSKLEILRKKNKILNLILSRMTEL